jgi:hypothetical protein
MGAPVLQTNSHGFPAQYNSEVYNLYPNQNGDNVSVTCAGGETLIAIALGLKDYDPFDLLHSTTAYPGYLLGINDYNPNPVIADFAGGVSVDIVATSVTSNVITVQYTNPNATSYFATTQSVTLTNTQESAVNGQTVVVASVAQVEGSTWKFTAPLTTANYSNADDTGDATPAGNAYVLQANLNQFGSDYTVSATPPTAPNPYPSVKWSLDGFLPSVVIWSAVGVAAGTYNINLNSMFVAGTVPQWQYGRPIFDGGVNFMVIKFTGMTAASGDGGSVSSSSSTANPAVGTAFITTGTGDLVIAVGLQKSANGIGLGTDGTLTAPGYQMVANGKLVGSEAHYLVEWGIQTAAGSYTPQFANPLGYETLIAAVAIKHS